MKVSEWSILAGQIIAGRQERVKEFLEDIFGDIAELTVGELIEILQDSRDEIQFLIS